MFWVSRDDDALAVEVEEGSRDRELRLRSPCPPSPTAISTRLCPIPRALSHVPDAGLPGNGVTRFALPLALDPVSTGTVHCWVAASARLVLASSSATDSTSTRGRYSIRSVAQLAAWSRVSSSRYCCASWSACPRSAGTGRSVTNRNSDRNCRVAHR